MVMEECYKDGLVLEIQLVDIGFGGFVVLEHQSGFHFVGSLLSLDMSKDSKTEFDSPARSSSGDDVAVNYDTFLYVFRTFGCEGFLKSVIAGHLFAFKVWQKAQNHAWCRADSGYCASLRIMLLHYIHEFAECGKVG